MMSLYVRFAYESENYHFIELIDIVKSFVFIITFIIMITLNNRITFKQLRKNDKEFHKTIDYRGEVIVNGRIYRHEDKGFAVPFLIFTTTVLTFPWMYIFKKLLPYYI
ncbi:hypothetical protein [Abyssisolibacter fermentans]|uniref:hypothetical protein n=1 Tax=Abyssisolibacter fermentans TaxID=1766203 RepID=UPI0012E399EC|nr:hypothetical protein [Abyssisolibacter fermentans]